jgi:hypothetical protein
LGKTEVIRKQVVERFRSLIRDRFMNIINTMKHKENAIVLRNKGDLLDISSDVLGESSSGSSLVVLNG